MQPHMRPFCGLAASHKRLHIGGMAKDRILIKPVGWEVFLVHDGSKMLLAFAGSEAQAKRYAKQAEAKYGLKKKKKKNDRATDPLPVLK
jgi:hypothetical protein